MNEGNEQETGGARFKTIAKSEKVSDSIISQIRDSILSGQLKPGDRLASEKTLISQFGVSKATMREALRVLEVMGLLEIRKGLGGGAFVAEVNMKTTINSIINFMHFQSLSVHDITMMRYLIEPEVAQVAATLMNEKDAETLKRIVGEEITHGESELSKEIGFHRHLARMSGNTILILIVDFMDNLLRSLKSRLNLGLGFYQQVREAHQVILECMLQRDPVAAGIAMSTDLLQVGKFLARLTDSRAFDPRELHKDWTVSDLQLSLDPQTRVVPAGNPALKQKGILMRRVGDSSFYLLSAANVEVAPLPSLARDTAISGSLSEYKWQD